MFSDKEYLAHFGVKGMRWGFRKKREASSNSGGAGKKKHTFKKVLTAAAVIGSAAAIGYGVATGRHTAVINRGRQEFARLRQMYNSMRMGDLAKSIFSDMGSTNTNTLGFSRYRITNPVGKNIKVNSGL